MSDSVVVKSGEIRTSYNSIKNYAEFLIRQCEAYMRVLSSIQKNGIQDQLICSKLSAIAEALKPVIANLDALINTDVKNILNKDIADISAADSFMYPEGYFETIASLLAAFLG